jgi:ABC-type transport system involved in multi-copper enzyme maturation permease subunit
MPEIARQTHPLRLTWVLAKWTAIRQIKRKMTYLLLFVGLLPCLQVVLWVLRNAGMWQPTIRPFGFFVNVASYFYVDFFLALLALFLGLGMINDEVESGNYLFLRHRPLGFLSQVGGRFLGCWLTGIALFSACLGTTYLTGMIFQGEDLLVKLPVLAQVVVVCAFALAAYMAVISAFGTTWKWFSVLISCIWLVMDAVFASIPVAFLQSISVKHHLNLSLGSLIPRHLPSLVAVRSGTVLLHLAVLLLFVGASWLYSAWWLSRFESKKIHAN